MKVTMSEVIATVRYPHLSTTELWRVGRSSLLGVLSFTAGLAVCGTAVADDVGREAAPAPQASPLVHVQLEEPRQPQRPPHDVAITSDTDGTRILSIDTSGMFVAGQVLAEPRQQVCVAPCTAPLTPSATYMIRGYLITDSPHFGISDTTKTLEVHTGSAIVSTLGATSLSLGVLSAIAGGVLLVTGLTENSTDSHRSTFMSLGPAGLVVGAALTGIGLVLGFVSTTHVYDDHRARLANVSGPRLTLSGLAF
jgi:hypothetical protein